MICLAAALILAADDWIKLIGPVVMILIWVIHSLLGGDRKPQANKARGARRPNPVARPPQPPAPPAPARALQNDEIDVFLKRASDRRRENLRRNAERTAKEPARSPKSPPRRLVETPVDVEVVSAPSGGETIAAHVQQHLSTGEFTTRAEHLTDDLTRGDVEREQHRKKVFSHQIGRLTDTTGSAPESAGPDAQSASLTGAGAVAKVFADRQNVRSAIILSEVLNRPTSRWD